MSGQRAAGRLATAGIDAVALKPAEHDLRRAADLPAGSLVVDYEGREHLPGAALLAELAAGGQLRVTMPVRADGFDPLGDDSLLGRLPDAADAALVAGHGAYLDPAERERAVAPRLRAALERFPGAWVGTEGIERVALATGAPQYELLSRATAGEVRALRAAGFEGTVAVYAPTVLSDDPDALLDAVGDYVARRGPVAAALPDGAPTDATATGRAREVLLAAAEDYALAGSPAAVGQRVAALREAGVDVIVGYPARGLDSFLE